MILIRNYLGVQPGAPVFIVKINKFNVLHVLLLRSRYK